MNCERLTSDTTVQVLIEAIDRSGQMIYFGMTLNGNVLPNVHCRILISPVLHPGVFPPRLSQFLLESLGLEAEAGGKFGFPLTSCCLTVASVDYCDKRSTEMAVRLAACEAFRQFLQHASFLIDNF